MDMPMTRRRVLQQGAATVMGMGLAGAFLQSCGGLAQPQPSGTSTPSSGPVTLTYGWWSNDPTHDNAMRSWLDDFEKSHPNIKIKSELLPWNVYWDKVRTTMASGNAYDVIGVAGFNAAVAYNSNALVDLKTFPDYEQVAGVLQPVQLQANNWDEKQYGLPIGVFVPFIGYNRDLFKAENLPDLDPSTPITFDQLKELARKLTKRKDGKVVQYGLHPRVAEYETLVYMEGGQVYDNPINPKKVTINTPEGVRGLENYLSLFKEDIAVPYDEITNSQWGDSSIGSLQTGKVAMAIMIVAYFNKVKDEAPYVGCAPPFTINRSVSFGGSNALGIYKGSKFKNEAWEFLKWSSQPASQMTFAKFSDLPTNNATLDKMSEYMPAEYVPTLKQSMSVFQPFLVTPHTELGTTMTEILADMVHGKLTPAAAAEQMQKRGNEILAAGGA